MNAPSVRFATGVAPVAASAVDRPTSAMGEDPEHFSVTGSNPVVVVDDAPRSIVSETDTPTSDIEAAGRRTGPRTGRIR